MTDIQIFKNEQFGEVRTIAKDGEPWFVANDVCRVLEFANSSDVIKRLDDDEKSGVVLTDPHGRAQNTNVVSEAGLYTLVLGSRKPEALFADAVAASDNSILVGELAKILRQNGVETGQNRLFQWMRENGYIMRYTNMPTQYSMERGLMEVKERAINNPDGSVRITQTIKVTGKGQAYFVNKFIGGREE